MPTPNRTGRRRRPPRVDRPPQEMPEPPDIYDTTELESAQGLLDIRPEGYGFLRVDGYVATASDVYVARSQIQRLGLRPGDLVAGGARPPKPPRDVHPALVRVELVDGRPADEAASRPGFDRLPAPSPTSRFRLEHDAAEPVSRILDLLAPIGRGQRALIVAPPKAGKTTVMRRIAQAIASNDPDTEMTVLLVDERPEEAYHWQESLCERADVVASTFDRPLADHVQTAELVLERAKRRVESGGDVVILLDSLTRLARTYNLNSPSTGRVLTGGIDATALDPPKRFFGTARNIKDGGSLTIIATCLVETGSRMDDVIFEEFKGRGNLEIRLDRALAEKRLYPAVAVDGTSTRNEELLVEPDELTAMWRLRRALHAVDPQQALEILLRNVGQTKTNSEFLDRVAQVQ